MTYAHITDGTVDRIGLPRTGALADGSHVSAYDRLPEDVLLAEGWLPPDDPDPCGACPGTDGGISPPPHNLT